MTYSVPEGFGWRGFGGLPTNTTGIPKATSPAPATANPPAPGGGSTGGGTTTPPADPGKSAFDILADIFRSYGMEISADLDTILRDMLTGGYEASDINLFMPEIQKTTSFKKRFPGFDARVSNGYNAIDIPTYLQLENQYHRILQQAGLPEGFYDDPSDFGQWIANNVSVDEVAERTTLAVRTAQSIDPTMRSMLTQFYGLTTGDLAAYFLDQSRALPTIERQYNSAQVATWAKRAGFEVTDISRFEDLTDKGVTGEQAAQAYGTVKQLSDTVGRMASVYGETYSQADAENDVFFNQSEKRQRIVSREQASFSGRSEGATGSARRTGY